MYQKYLKVTVFLSVKSNYTNIFNVKCRKYAIYELELRIYVILQ